jgi:hypothetical protein
VDSPSEGEVSLCLGFWILNPSASQVWLHCIVYLITSFMPCILVEEPYMFYPHVFSCNLEKLLQLFMGMTEKARRLLFCLGNSKPLSLRSGLILPYMLGLEIISFLHKHFLFFFVFFF